MSTVNDVLQWLITDLEGFEDDVDNYDVAEWLDLNRMRLLGYLRELQARRAEEHIDSTAGAVSGTRKIGREP